jgi:hypothetical protein
MGAGLGARGHGGCGRDHRGYARDRDSQHWRSLFDRAHNRQCDHGRDRESAYASLSALFYLPPLPQRSLPPCLVDILTRRQCDFVDGAANDCQHQIRPMISEVYVREYTAPHVEN